MSRLLNHQLQKLRQQIQELAESVQQSLRDAVQSLLDADAVAAQSVCDGDRAINARRYTLETDIVSMIATQQPMAGDLRLLIGVLEIATELERMGDYAKDIARIAIRQQPHGTPEAAEGTVPMMDCALSMAQRTVRAFCDSDAQLARQVVSDDDRIDEACQRLHRELLERARVDENVLEETVRLLPVVHNIERFADRVTNICERIVFIVTGEQVEFEG